MVKSQFARGVILGLVVGVPVGLLLAAQLMGPQPDRAAVPSLQVQELRRKLEAATYARERAEQQLEQFQKLAEQMTATFNRLEERFKALDATTRGSETAATPPPNTP